MRKHSWTSLVSLLVLTLFALCLLLVLLAGAGVYRRLTEAGEESFAQTTAAQYLATRVRQGRTPEIQDFAGCEALVFSEEIGNEIYLTRVYCYDGWLRELYSAETASLHPQDGEKVLQSGDLDFTLEDGLLTIWVNGEASFFTVREGRAVHAE